MNNDNFLGHYIFNIEKIYKKRVNNILKQVDITLSELRFIYHLYIEDNITQEELANKLKYNQSSITKALKRLENKNIIIRETSSEDKRKKIVKLTPKGRDVYDTIQNMKIDDRLLENYSNSDKEELKRCLKKLYEELNI